MKKRSMMKDFKKIIALVALLFCTQYTSAFTDGGLDASFNGTGLSVLLDSDSVIKSLAIQDDGKIVAAGSSDRNGKESFYVVRYNTDGSLDTTFGQQGEVFTKFGAGETASGAHAVVIQDDGKIVAAGFTDAVRNAKRWCIARYNPDGSPDETFFGDRGIFKGTVITIFGGDSTSTAYALALSPDGKIVVAGTSKTGSDKAYFTVARYNADGSLDTAGFNAEGKGSAPGTARTTFGDSVYDDHAYAVAVHPNGKIIVAGSSMLTGVKTFALARYNSNGSLDTSFFSPGFARYNGTVVTNFAAGQSEGAIHALLIQADGKIIAAGSTNSNSWRPDISHFALARYDNRGILDANFGGYGLARTPGTVISTFGAQEGASTINALALQNDGKIVAGGTVSINGKACFALARYNPDGTLDVDFNDGRSPAGKVITALHGKKYNEIFAVALQSNGDIVAAGSTDMHGRPQALLARYLSNDMLLQPSITHPKNNSVIVNGSAVKIGGSSQNPGILKIFVDENPVGSLLCRGTCSSWNYQLPPLASGTHSIKVVEHYAGGNINLRSQPINITIDQHPKPVNATVSTCGFNAVQGTLEATGASGDYKFEIISSINGRATLDGADFSFFPTVGSGVGVIVFKVTDTTTKCCSQQGTITVTINDLPATQTSHITACQNNVVNGSLVESVSGGNAPYNFALIGTAYGGTVTLNADGTFTFVPTDGFSGTAHFQYQVTDANGCESHSQVVQITVWPAPNAQNASFTTHEAELLTGTVANLVTGGTAPYQFNLVECPGNCAITLQQNGSFVMIPMLGFAGASTFKYQVVDAHNCVSNVATISITVFELPVATAASMTMCQNAQLSQSLAALVTKGTQPYTFSQVGAAVNGLAVIAADGTVTFTPNTDFSGTATFTYQVTDSNNGSSAVATVTITVNELPKVSDLSVVTCQETPVSGSLATQVSAGLPPYNFIATDTASNGELAVNADGSFSFNPAVGFNGITSFHYQVSDANGCMSLPATVIITVQEKPTAQNGTNQTCANHPIDGSFAMLVSGGNAPYTFTIDGVENGTATVNVDGSYLFTPAQDAVGAATITYHANDQYCASNSATITVTINPSPSVIDSAASTLENASVSGNLSALASNGMAPYTFAAVGPAINGAVTVNSDGSYEFIPTAGYFGTATFNYQASDIHGCVSNSGTATIAVFQLPQITNGAAAGVINTQITGTLENLVLVGAAPFAFQKVTDPINGSLVINPDGTYIYTPNVDFVGNDSFQYQISDAHSGMSTVATFSLGVYKPVRITAEKVFGVCLNTPIQATLKDVVHEGLAPYAFSVVNAPAQGTVQMSNNGSFTYNPGEGFAGDDSFTYQVTDALSTSAQGTARIIVYQVPSIQDKQWTIFESGTLQDSVASLVTGQGPFMFSQLGAVNGSVTVAHDGSFNFVPAPEFIGIANFQFAVTDFHGCTSQATITINVVELPKAQNGSIHAITNGSFVGSLVTLVSGGTAPYTFQMVTAATNGTVNINEDGSYTYTPNPEYAGTDSFAYQVTDANNGASNTATISITIYESVRIIDQKSYTSCPNTIISGTVSDVAVDGQLPYTFSLVNAPNNGTTQMNADGSFTYTPAQGFSGSDSFTYSVSDALLTHAQGTVNITIHHPPLLNNKQSIIFESATLTDSLAPLVSGNGPFTFAQVGTVLNGALQFNADGSFSFTPAPAFVGTVQFQYTVTDSNGCTNAPATISIEVVELPKATDGTAVGPTNSVISGSLASLVSGGATPYSFQKIADPAHGTVVVNSDGSYSYAPNAQYVGADSFSYLVTDSNNGTEQGNVNITVATVPVIANVNNFQICANNALSQAVSNSVSDGVPPYTFAIVTNVQNGALAFNADGSFTYTPAQGYNGPDNFLFAVTDSIGTMVQAEVNLTVNQTPRAQDNSWKTGIGTLTDSLALLVSGGQPPYVFEQVGTATNAQVQINSDGTFDFSASTQGNTVGSFMYQVTDSNGCSSNIGTATVTVNPPPTARGSTFVATQDQLFSGDLNSIIVGGSAPYIFGQVGTAKNGTVAINRNGQFTFNPASGFSGVSSFDFIVTDKNGESSAIITANIMVNASEAKRSTSNSKNSLFKRYLNGKNK